MTLLSTASAAPPTAPRVQPLGPEQIAQLQRARALNGKVRRAVRVATFDAWSIAIFAGLTVLTSLFDPSGLLLGVGMAFVAALEFHGAGRLRRLDLDATRLLGFNQLALAAMLILYALWNIRATLTGPGPFAAIAAQGGAVADMIKPYENLTRSIALSAYAALIVVALVMQGSTALFYFTRARHLRAYLQQTPAWILQLQGAGLALD